MLTISITWDKKVIAYDKSIGRNDGIYPDTVLWGVSVNGVSNPTLAVFLEELSKSVNALQHKRGDPNH